MTRQVDVTADGPSHRLQLLDDASKVIRSLSQRGARLRIFSAEAEFVGTSHRGRKKLRVALDVVRHLQVQGLIESAETPGDMVLTAKARSELRRCLVADATARAQGVCLDQREGSCVEADAASSTGANPSRVAQTPAGRRMATPDSVLAWLRQRRDRNGEALITAEQFMAGERLTADMFYARMMPRTTASYSLAMPASRASRSSANGRADLSDAAIDARQRVQRAMSAVGPEFSGLLFEICGHGRGLEDIERSAALPPRSGKVALQFALTLLARHYGLIPRERAHWPGRSGVRHWGAPDYRPGLEGLAES